MTKLKSNCSSGNVWDEIKIGYGNIKIKLTFREIFKVRDDYFIPAKENRLLIGKDLLKMRIKTFADENCELVDFAASSEYMYILLQPFPYSAYTEIFATDDGGKVCSIIYKSETSSITALKLYFVENIGYTMFSYVHCHNRIFRLDGKEVSEIDESYNCLFNFHGLFRNFPEYGIAFSAINGKLEMEDGKIKKDDDTKYLYALDSALNFKNLGPLEKDAENICYDGNRLIVVNADGSLRHCELMA